MFSKKASYEEQEEEDFRCPKCKWYFSTMTKPYILPCNHHICLKCIDQLILENKTICPICEAIFNKEERDSFQINIVFLNILIKILQSKIILCKNCNKIFYWKEHYNTCDQSFFIETNELFNDIKLSCEEGIKIIKSFNNKSNILIKYKNNIFSNIKRAIKEISNLYKKEINIEIKKLFLTQKRIDFFQNKKEILFFLELCLSYNNYFDENQIADILDKYNQKKSPNKNFQIRNRNNYGLSPIHPEMAPHSPYLIKNINQFPAQKSSTIMISEINKGNNTALFNKNNRNNFKIIKDNNNIYRNNNNINFMKEEQSYNLFSKMINDNNNNNNNNKIINYINVNRNDNINKLRKNFYLPRHISNTVFYSSNTKPKHKKNRFNIYDILNEDEPNEENEQKKIIVGLKDVKVISKKELFKKEKENELNKKNLICMENKNINILNNCNYENNIYINYNKNINKINKNYNYNNDINDESEASTIRIENPSLSLLRSTEFTKRIFPLKADDKRKKLLKYQKACEDYGNEENLILKNKISKINNNKNKNNKISNSYANLLNNNIIIKENIKENKNKINKIGLSSMNRLIKHFNKIKDIVNDLNNFENFLTFISEYTSKNIDYNLLHLGNIILNDYNLLLNEITYNFNQSYRHSMISFIENTKKIYIYNTNLKKFIIKDFQNILPQINSFDKSISIDYDDNDLIFISGGLEDTAYNCRNIFIILKWSKEKIEYNGNLPDRKAYHSTFYYDNKLYLVGGIDSNKKVSKECKVFSLNDKKWHNLPNLNVGRKNSSICIYNNKVLYAFRGSDENNVLDTIEYIKLFNLRSSWKIFKPIDYGYVWNAAENSLVMTIDKGKILICGGEDNEGNLLNDTFLFETDTNKIYKGIDLAFPAAFRSNGSLNKGKYYCIGIKNENNNNSLFGDVHIFDPKENIWTIN